MYSNFHGVGPPSQNMIIAPEAAYPATPARYALARRDSSSPSPERDLPGLPKTTFEPASPTGNSGGGWSSSHHHNGSGGGGAFASRRSHSVSPIPSIPSNSALGSTYHGTREPGGTSVGHAPPSSFSHRQPGKEGNGSMGGTGSGSGGTSAPSLMTAGARGTQRVSSPTLGDMYPPEYEQFSRPASSAAQVIEPQVGYAYEPEPVLHNHQIVADLAEVQGAYDGLRSPFSADIATMSVASRSMYSREDDESEEGHAMDSRLDPLMRMRGGIASAASVGPRDHEDYMRRVVPQLHSNSSTASHSHSMVQSHSTH
ncbi:hypothetical protein M408DRAFT_325315 [Serendipita vermifera MAFF 305830]|nr:hypothetical protein M408DRAFT_325315 [Serendipita vermifera MAFF 305830]